MTDTPTRVDLATVLDRAEAAAAPLADIDPHDRARALVAVADRLDDAANQLIPLACHRDRSRRRSAARREYGVPHGNFGCSPRSLPKVPISMRASTRPTPTTSSDLALMSGASISRSARS